MNALEKSGVIVATCIVAVIGVIFFGLQDLCGNEMYKVYVSPDKNLKAVIFQRDCGATTGFSTQISILEAGEELKNKNGNIFSISGHPEQVAPHLKWENSHQLNVNRRLNGKEFLALVELGWFNKIKVKYRGSNI